MEAERGRLQDQVAVHPGPSPEPARGSERRRGTAPLLAISLLLTALAAGCAADWPEFEPATGMAAAASRRGRSAMSIEEVMTLPDRDIDLGRAALLIAAELHPGLQPDAEMARMDRLAQEAARQIGRGGSAREAVEELSSLLLGRRAVAYHRARSSEDFDVTEVLTRRRGNCLSCTMLYLAVADRLGLEVHAVSAPGHIFMRYDDGERTFNIEPTLGGRSLPDLRYRLVLDVSREAERRGLYLRSLSRREFLAEVLAARGGYWAENGQPARARRDLELALAVLPSATQALVNSGFLAASTGQRAEAKRLYRQVLVVDPQNAAALNNLAAMLIDDPADPDFDADEAWRLAGAAVRHSDGASADRRAACLDTAARVAALRSDWREAVRMAKKACALAPERNDYRARWTEYVRRAGEAARPERGRPAEGSP